MIGASIKSNDTRPLLCLGASWIVEVGIDALDYIVYSATLFRVFAEKTFKTNVNKKKGQYKLNKNIQK